MIADLPVVDEGLAGPYHSPDRCRVGWGWSYSLVKLGRSTGGIFSPSCPCSDVSRYWSLCAVWSPGCLYRDH